MLKSEKCEISKTSVRFLGQIINGTGVRAGPDEVRTVSNMEESGKYLTHPVGKKQSLRATECEEHMDLRRFTTGDFC